MILMHHKDKLISGLISNPSFSHILLVPSLLHRLIKQNLNKQSLISFRMMAPYKMWSPLNVPWCRFEPALLSICLMDPLTWRPMLCFLMGKLNAAQFDYIIWIFICLGIYESNSMEADNFTRYK